MSNTILYCSFCAKRNDEVEHLIAGPVAFICSECVELAVDIVLEKRAEAEARRYPHGNVSTEAPPLTDIGIHGVEFHYAIVDLTDLPL